MVPMVFSLRGVCCSRCPPPLGPPQPGAFRRREVTPHLNFFFGLGVDAVGKSRVMDLEVLF
jgi:hypothetical protein